VEEYFGSFSVDVDVAVDVEVGGGDVPDAVEGRFDFDDLPYGTERVISAHHSPKVAVATFPERRWVKSGQGRAG
jgi:hypothetical protein